MPTSIGSNNTNKWDAQEQRIQLFLCGLDQIIPINGMLKNMDYKFMEHITDQIIPINGMLKNI